ncbi:hypothetical protein HDF16_002627 [Granulicella aggregans]|uniref:Heparinase II/III-like C-terminal domain-containing protein n=1 Tax=Granulicella aggregans TaxID=474949 RepID=A0A7W7ZDI7_9BACT|nr:heparinase II/III family protein [Granulicella aggregans]MBB5057921.1 hypothetical protein [Granulicella aggregans]
MRLVAALCLAVLCGLIANAQTIRFASPVDFQTHFEPHPGAASTSGSRDGWESFPLAQEAGYDPSIQPETANGESVLVRELAPTRDGFFQLGFIRRVCLLSGDHALIRFRVRAPYIVHETAVHLHIFRGAADEQHDFTLTGNDWQQISTELNVSTTQITAIALAVDFPHSIHGRPERVMFSNLHLAALAAKHVPIIQPATLWDGTRELFYLQRSLAPSEELTLRAASANRWSITAPDDTEAARGTGNEVRYRMPQDARPGIWKIHLETKDSESTALVLVRPARSTGLVFDTPPTITLQLIASIRERKAQLEKLTVADAGRNIALMSREWLLPGLSSYFTEILQPSELALMDAMLFRATGDQAALDQARMLLTTMAAWPTWTHPWFSQHGYHSYYPVGLMTRNIVMAEQFLGADLPAGDRSLLDRGLISLSVKPTYEEYVAEDRLQFNHSNWIGNTVGGALLAALASDDPEAAGYALGLFAKERDHVHAAYTGDGSYGEGITYHRFDLETTALAAAAAKRLLGTSIDGALLNPERYMRYAAFNPTDLLDFGDSHVDLKPANVFAYIAALNQSAATTDFYFRYRDEGTTQILPRVLWESQIKPVAPPNPGVPSALFPERGVAVLRDSWKPNSVVLAMRAGRNFNHNHADQGSVSYAAQGILWLGEAGYADYYKDPNYDTFNTQAIGHNTLLVDGNPESQVLPGNEVFGTSPRFTQTLFGDRASMVEADLTSVYPMLASYRRTLIHLADGPTVVIDDVVSTMPHTFTTVWHPEQEVTEFVPEENRLLLSHAGNKLELRSLADTAVKSTMRHSPFPLSAYERSEHGPISAPMQLEVTTRDASNGTLLVSVLSPQAGEVTWKAEGRRHVLIADGWTLDITRAPGNRLAISARSADGAIVDLSQ